MIHFFTTIFHNLVIMTAHAASLTNTVVNARDAVASSRIPFTSYLGLGTECGQNVPDGRFLACYVASVYTFFVRAAIILAVLMVVMGGLRWILAVGEVPKVKEAKEMIVGAITGLVLALISFVLFAQINSNLVNLEPIDITPINIVTSTVEPGVFQNYGNQTPQGYCQLSNTTPSLSKLVLHNISSQQLLTMHPSLVQVVDRLNTLLEQKKFSKVYLNSVTDDHIWTKPKNGSLCTRAVTGQGISGSCQHSDSYHYGGPANQCMFDASHPPVSCAIDLQDPAGALGSIVDGNFYPELKDIMIEAGFDYVQCEKKGDSDDYPCGNPGVNHIHGQILAIPDQDPTKPTCYSVIQPITTIDTTTPTP